MVPVATLLGAQHYKANTGFSSPNDHCTTNIATLAKKKKKTRIDVYETLCPQQMLVHKGGKIKNWGGECRDVTPTKSLSQKYQGRCEQRREVFVETFFFFFLGGGGGGGGQIRGVTGWM